MERDEEIRSIKEKLDYYTMEADDEQFDAGEVRKLQQRLDVLEPIPLPWKSADEALTDFLKYFDERQGEDLIIAEMTKQKVGTRF